MWVALMQRCLNVVLAPSPLLTFARMLRLKGWFGGNRLGPILRGVRNVLRSPLRTGAILVLLTVSVSTALVMIQVRGSIDRRAQEARETIGTAIQVRLLGASLGGSQPLTDADIQSLEGLEHVVAISKVLEAQYGGEALQPAIDPASFGDHGGGAPGVFGGASPTTARRIPISFSGVSFADGRGLFEAGEATLTSGRVFKPDDASTPVAVLGQTLAEKNSLSLGSVFQLETGQPLEVIGIFSAGHQWGDNTVYMPLSTMRQLMGVEDWISSATVYVDSVDDLEIVMADITKTLGEGRVDVTSGLESMERLTEPLEALRSTSSVGLLAALVGAGGVILLAMFVLVRERAREIGILKAIGASWRQVVTQFAAEALAVSVVAAVLGFALAVASAETVAGEFFDPTPQTAQVGASSGQHQAGGGGWRGHQGGGGFFESRLSAASLGPLDISVSPDLLLYALVGAVVLSILGSILAAVYIARLSPAEVLRYE